MVASRRRVSYPCKIIATKNQRFPRQIYNGHIRGVCGPVGVDPCHGVLNIFQTSERNCPDNLQPLLALSLIGNEFRYAEDRIFSLFAFWSRR